MFFTFTFFLLSHLSLTYPINYFVGIFYLLPLLSKYIHHQERDKFYYSNLLIIDVDCVGKTFWVLVNLHIILFIFILPQTKILSGVFGLFFRI